MINSPVTDIRPIRNITPIVPTDPHLRLDLEFNDLVTNSIKHILSHSNDPLQIEEQGLNPATITTEQQSFYTLRAIFNVLNCNQYNLNLLKFSTNPPVAQYYSNSSDNTQDALLRYLLSCKPAKISSLLTLLAVYKHFCIGTKDKWRKLYSTNRYRWGHNSTLLNGVSSYLHTYYVRPNMYLTERSGIETNSKLSQPAPNIHWFWESSDPWIVNDTNSFEELAALIVKSGLVSVYNIYVNSSRAAGFDINSLNLCVKPEITEEFLSDYLTFCLSPDHFMISFVNSTPFALAQNLHSGVVPARAAVLQKKFKRFNRVRTQILMRIPFLLDDPSAFGSDFMTLEFEAETRRELKQVTSSYRNMCGNMLQAHGVKPRPQTELLYFVKELREHQEVVNAKRRYEAHIAPALAIYNVMSKCYNQAEAVAIMESHLREYR